MTVDPVIVVARVTVETPQGVDFKYVMAGPGKRDRAYFVDFVLRVSLVAGCTLVAFFAGIPLGMPQGVMMGVMLVGGFTATCLYIAIFEAFMWGQTRGKRMFNLRVLRTNGIPVSWI